MASIFRLLFTFILVFRLSPGVSLRLAKSALKSKLVQPILLICTSCLITLSPVDITHALATSNLSLEQSIQRLESADNRKDAIQAMADVFEATESRSLQAKTKYKQRIILAINNKHVKLNSEWDQALSYASGELKRRVDPFRTVDLGEYLRIAPFVGGAAYLASLFVQQTLPELFIFAYPLAVFFFAAPIVYIITLT